MTTIGAVILAGGAGTRMGGLDKVNVRLGGRSLLDRVLSQVGDFPEVILSVDSPERHSGRGHDVVVDAVPGRGPMQGLAQALTTCRSDALLALAADMPLFTRGVADYLAAFFHPGCGAVAARDRTGRRHPLCAIYAKRAGEILHEELAAGRRRLGDALARLGAVDAPLMHSIYPDSALLNVNTPEDLRNAAKYLPPPVVAVCGRKDSGKTTLLCRLLPLLRQKGLRVGVIKHDGHDFVPDVPGTDSFRLRAAGAERVAVYSPERMMLTREESGLELDSLLPEFMGLDLVLVEGGKHTPLPKVEVVRAHQGGCPTANPEGLLAICSDADIGGANVPVFPLDDANGLCRFMEGRFPGGRGNA